MNAIELVIKRLENWISKVEEITIDEIKKESALIEQLNRNQLMSGINADGGDMPKYKQGSKQPQAPGKIKLFDTGAFQRGIKASFDNEGIDMNSTDFKNAFLNPYRKAIETLGLTDNSIEELQEKILPRIIKRLKAI